jgi:hypothetical protein
MSANTNQIFSIVGDVQWIPSGLGANTAMDGTGTTALIFTADATNGGRVERVNVVHLGTNIASLLRFFVNNGSTAGTAANNTLIEELAMPANAVSQVAISVPQALLRVPIVLPPGYTLRVAVATAVAAGYQITTFGGKY